MKKWARGKERKGKRERRKEQEGQERVTTKTGLHYIGRPAADDGDIKIVLHCLSVVFPRCLHFLSRLSALRRCCPAALLTSCHLFGSLVFIFFYFLNRKLTREITRAAVTTLDKGVQGEKGGQAVHVHMPEFPCPYDAPSCSISSSPSLALSRPLSLPPYLGRSAVPWQLLWLQSPTRLPGLLERGPRGC